MNLKNSRAARFRDSKASSIDCAEIDARTLRPFTGSHPRVMRVWLPQEDGLYRPNPAHRLTPRERKHRLMLVLEKWFGWDSSKKHCRLVA